MIRLWPRLRCCRSMGTDAALGLGKYTGVAGGLGVQVSCSACGFKDHLQTLT